MQRGRPSAAPFGYIVEHAANNALNDAAGCWLLAAAAAGAVAAAVASPIIAFILHICLFDSDRYYPTDSSRVSYQLYYTFLVLNSLLCLFSSVWCWLTFLMCF